jgi:hypothetical protein
MRLKRPHVIESAQCPNTSPTCFDNAYVKLTSRVSGGKQGISCLVSEFEDIKKDGRLVFGVTVMAYLFLSVAVMASQSIGDSQPTTSVLAESACSVSAKSLAATRPVAYFATGEPTDRSDFD